jgi:hypothetical protein
MSNQPPLRTDPLPRPIVEALRLLIQRVRTVVIIRGLAAIVAAALGSLLAVMAIDAAVKIDTQWPRYLLTLSAFIITGASAVWFLVLPLARTITLTGIARALETRHPELQERLSSAIQLLTSRDMPSVRGSEALIRALAQEATEDAERVQPSAEISLASAKPFLLAAAGVLLVFAGTLAAFPHMATRLLERAVAPYANFDNIYADMLTVTPGKDVTIPENERLEIGVSVHNATVKQAALRKRLPDGSELTEPMTPLAPAENGDARFALTLPPATANFTYRITAGNALTRYYSVTVQAPPIVQQLDLRYDYPAYTAKPADTESPSPGDIRAVVGTTVTLTAHVNKPVAAPELRLNGTPLPRTPLQAGASDGRTWQFQVPLTANLKGRWALSLKDEYGFTSTSPDHALEALPDRAPVAKLLNPEKKLRLKPTDHLPLVYEITDDFGLVGVEVAVDTDVHKGVAVPVPLAVADDKAGPLRTASGETSIALASLALQGAKQVTLRLRATDNLPADSKGPQVGQSEAITIELDGAAASYASQTLKAEEQEIHRALDKILAELRATKEDSVPLKAAVAKVPVLTDDLSQRIARMRQHLGSAKAATGEILAKVPDGTFTGMEPKLKALAAEVGGADDRTGDIKLIDIPRERGAAAETADQHVDRAIALVQELLKQLKEIADVVQLAQTLTDMAQQEADLAAAKAAAEMATPAQPDPEWQKEQGKLAKEVAELVKSDPAALAAELAKQTAAAKDLASEAGKLQKEQQNLGRDTADLAKLKDLNAALQNLAASQAALAKSAAAVPAAAPQAPTMDAAAKDIATGNLAKAVQEQSAAEADLQQKADGKAPAGQQPLPPEQRAAAAQVAAAQEEIRKQTQALLAQENQLAKDMMAKQAERLQTEQNQVAREATELAQNLTPVGGDPNQQGEKAAAEAQQAAANLPKDVNAAAQEATEAAKALDQAAKDLAQQAAQDANPPQEGQPNQANPPEAGAPKAGEAGAPKAGEAGAPKAGEAGAPKAGEAGAPKAGAAGAPKPGAGGAPKPGGGGAPKPGAGGAPTPAQMADMAQQAAALAEREQQLAQEMQALANQNPQQLLAAEQNALGQQTAELQQAANLLGQEAQAMAPQSPAAQQAAQAAGALGQAKQAEGQAQQAMAAGQPQAAAPAQQNAAQALGQAAGALNNMTQALAQASQAAAQQAPPNAASPTAQPMADAFNEATQAAQNNSATAAAEAAQSLAQAAGQASKAASAAGAKPGAGTPSGKPGSMAGQPGKPGPSKDSSKGTGLTAVSQDAVKLQKMGIKLSDWAKLPGELKSQILQAADDSGPEEYQAMIKGYFRKVAERGGATSEGGK